MNRKNEINLIDFVLYLFQQLIKHWIASVVCVAVGCALLTAVSFISSGAFSVSKAVLGAVLGLFVCAAVYVVIYIIGDTVKSVDDFNASDIELFGIEIRDDKENKLSKKIKDLRIGRAVKTAPEERANLIISRTDLAAKRIECKSLFISFGCKDDADIVSGIADALVSKGYDVSSGDFVSYSSDSIDRIISSDAVILICHIGQSTYRELNDSISVCKDNGKKLLGVVAVY